MTMKSVEKAVWGAVAAALLLVPAGRQQGRIDSRLATVRRARVVAVDALGEDAAIVSGRAEQLLEGTPNKVVHLEEANVVWRVRGLSPSTTTKVLVAVFGGRP